MEEQRADDVVSGANMAFRFPVLRRGVRAGETEHNTVGRKIITKRRGEKLAPVIALHTPNEYIELCRDKLEEAKKGVTCVRLGT